MAGIQNSETSRLDRKMVKLVPKSPVCKLFLFLFHDVIISCCLGKHPYCLNCVKYASRARGDTGVSLSPGVTSHMPRLQLFSTSSHTDSSASFYKLSEAWVPACPGIESFFKHSPGESKVQP